mgnify:CR=1 FL=1
MTAAFRYGSLSQAGLGLFYTSSAKWRRKERGLWELTNVSAECQVKPLASSVLNYSQQSKSSPDSRLQRTQLVDSNQRKHTRLTYFGS